VYSCFLGCAGVSRRYACDLIDEAAEVCAGVRIRETTDVQTSTGVEHKKKALLIDCEVTHTHTNGDGVNQFTTEGPIAQQSDVAETTSEGDR
jgi:hypothetical protein